MYHKSKRSGRLINMIVSLDGNRLSSSAIKSALPPHVIDWFMTAFESAVLITGGSRVVVEYNCSQHRDYRVVLQYVANRKEEVPA